MHSAEGVEEQDDKMRSGGISFVGCVFSPITRYSPSTLVIKGQQIFRFRVLCPGRQIAKLIIKML